MKHLIIFLLGAALCSAVEMVKRTEADFRQLEADQAAMLAELRTKLDLSKLDDRDFLDRAERQFYAGPMMKISDPYFRKTRLKPGDNWRALWKARESEALTETSGDPGTRAAIETALLLVRRIADGRDAQILERVVKAKFGGEPACVLLIHWERLEAVDQLLSSGKEAELGHFLIIGVRWSDRKLVARAQCG